MTEEKMEIVFSIAEEAMKQEQDRTSVLMNKSDKFFKYILSTMGIINTGLVFMLENKIIITDTKIFICVFLFINFPFFASLLMSVIAQMTFKRLNYPSGIQAIKDMAASKQEKQNYQVYKLKCMDQYTNALNMSNNKREKYIRFSSWCYILGFVSILLQGLIFFIKDASSFSGWQYSILGAILFYEIVYNILP